MSAVLSQMPVNGALPRGSEPLALQGREPQPVASNTKCGARGEERPVLGHGGPADPAGRPAAGGAGTPLHKAAMSVC